MGEARRRREAHETLDGGPPSDDKIAMTLEVFDPLREAVQSADRLRWSAIREMCARSHRRPTPICGGCDYEFALGEAPRLLFCTRPFIAKGEDFKFVAGAICPRCAALPTEALMAALMTNLRAVKPDAALVEGGHA